MAALIAGVVIIAYVARRSQVVGLPPGESKDYKPIARSSGGEPDAADANGP